MWSIHKESVLVGDFTDKEETRQCVVGFDLDGTLITTKSKSIFPKDKNDWKFMFGDDIVKNKLKELSTEFFIVIITNQKGLRTTSKIEEFKSKINDISRELKDAGIPFMLLASLKDDFYRKPSPGIIYLLKEILKEEKEVIFYCGDAAGRRGEYPDFSDSDLKFAVNLKIPFKTPEEIFL